MCQQLEMSHQQLDTQTDKSMETHRQTDIQTQVQIHADMGHFT